MLGLRATRPVTRGAQLIHIRVLIRDEVLAEHSFDQPKITIGRTPDNDVQLENLGLSRHHAEVVRVRGGWRLRDLDSRNGLHVNGERRQVHDLVDGDLVAIGKHVLAFSLPRLEVDPWAAPLDELVAQGKTVKLLPEPAPVPPPPERDSGSMAWLTVTRGGSGLFRLQRDVFLIGGAPGCELRLPGLLTPGRLALIVRGRSGWSLLNVTRRGDGVQRNGQSVRLRSWLEDGDRLELGEVTARFRISVGVPT